MAINLSRQQLMHRRLVDAVAKSLQETMLDPGCIELEIGDGDFPNRRKAEIDTLQGLRKLGVRVTGQWLRRQLRARPVVDRGH